MKRYAMRCEILSVLTGKAVPFGPETSAIGKTARAGSVAVGRLGLEGDEQADLSVHGGPDKAIHHYAYDHYPFWRALIAGQPLLDAPGAFGENVSTLGMTESEVCLGDRFRLGTALVEVSQGRQPCWKQGHRLSDPTVTAQIVAYRNSGWYYRVIEPGEVTAGDAIELIARPHPEWDVERMFGLLIGGDGRDDPAALRALAGMELLAQPWRQRAARMAQG
jgi:MOSC domain-containing protein YiiM